MGYDAFLSYSHADADLAEALQSSLQRFNKRWYRRRPFVRVARDEATFGAAEELDSIIVNALDQSDSLVLLLSPSAVESDWVNQELQHWMDTRGGERITFVVTEWAGADSQSSGDDGLGRFRWDGQDVPPAVRGVFREPLAVDMRWAVSPADWTLKNDDWSDAVAQIAAGIKGKDKDEFYGEVAAMRVRARIITTAVLLGLGILTAAIAVSLPSWYFAVRDAGQARSNEAAAEAAAVAAEQRQTQAETEQAEAETAAAAAEGLRTEAEAEAERIAPDNQARAFMNWLTEDLMESDPSLSSKDISIRILGTDNLNGDRLLDYFLFNETPGWCGSGGCQMEVYLSQGPGEYESVLDLWQHSDPRSRAGPEGSLRDVVATAHDVANEPVWSVYRWNGEAYSFSHYEFCGGISFEYCDPIVIEPLVETPQINLEPEACLLSAPDDLASPARCSPEGEASILGVVAGGAWHLVEVFQSEAIQYVGFVRLSTTEAPGTSVVGDLGLLEAMSVPPCDGSYITLLASVIDPSEYRSEVQALLDTYPGSSYLRTDVTGCSSLRQEVDGNPIYAVYFGPFDSSSAALATCSRAPADAYVKPLDNVSDPSQTIECS